MSWLTSFWKTLKTPRLAMPQAPPPDRVSLTPRAQRVVPSIEPLINLTPHAQQVLALARKEADRLKHHFMGTEHLLLGMLALGQGTAVAVLRKMGLGLDTVRREVEKQVGTGSDQKLGSIIPNSPPVKTVLTLAAKEAKALNHAYVGTEHILLGLLGERDGMASRVLKGLGLDLEKTRQAILTQLTPAVPPAPKVVAPSVTPPKPRDELVDTTRRYDVYCSERNQEVVVYRNVLIKGTKSLPKGSNSGSLAEFVEIEQANGQTVFVPKYSLLKFCGHGATPGAERVPGKKV